MRGAAAWYLHAKAQLIAGLLPCQSALRLPRVLDLRAFHLLYSPCALLVPWV